MNPQRSRQLAALAILAILGLGGGAGMRAWRQHQGVGLEGKSQDGALFAGSKLSGRAASAWNQLLNALGLKGSRRFSTSDLVLLLSGHERDAAAQTFLAEFRNDPRLMDLWNEYLRGADVEWLARRLGDSRAFTELLNRHADDQRFQEVAAGLARELESLLAQRSLENPSGDGIAGTAGLRAYAASRRAGGVNGRGPVDWRPPVLASVGPQSAGPLGSRAGAERYAASGETEETERNAKLAQTAAGQAGHADHEVAWRLKDSIVKAGNDRDIVRFLESLFATMPKGDRDILINLCAEDGICDPVEACSTSPALYESCRKSCASNPKCSIPFPPERPDPAAVCMEPRSELCVKFCDHNRQHPRCVEIVASARNAEIAEACRERPNGERCANFCRDNPTSSLCPAASISMTPAAGQCTGAARLTQVCANYCRQNPRECGQSRGEEDHAQPDTSDRDEHGVTPTPCSTPGSPECAAYCSGAGAGTPPCQGRHRSVGGGK